jgi:steroid delta-isomerase-like uncharacterized protein
MPVQENVALMKRWFQEVWNEGRVEPIYELMAENVIGIGQEVPGVIIHNPAEFLVLFNRIRGAFPDIKFTLDDVFGADDKVVVRWSAMMTHTGDHLGMPATNRPVHLTGITIAEIKNGKIIRGWDNWDQLALMQQVTSAAAAAAER